MRKLILLIVLLFTTAFVFAKGPKHQYVRISTNYGEVIIRLYNETPQHRDNFIKLARQGFYNGTLFHRVIQNFMIQGGDPDSKTAKPDQKLGDGDLTYKVPAEFKDSLFHKRGVLAAARDTNAAKASSATQFYIVEGKRWTDGKLDTLENTRLKGRKIPAWKREWYKTIGGVPHLDQNYTVYGEVISGLDMVDRIAGVKTDKNDRPLQDVAMTVTLLNKKECEQLDKLIAPSPSLPLQELN